MIRYLTILICVLPALRGLTQEVSFCLYHPLNYPASNIYDLSAAGLVGISDGFNLQLWDSRTQAYYGSLDIPEPENEPLRIRKLSYSPLKHQLAVLGEQVNFGPDSAKNYKGWLIVYDTHTLEPVGPPLPNGVAQLVRFDLPDNTPLPELHDSADIYDYFYQQQSDRLYTVDRNGKVSIYKNNTFEKELITRTARSCILVADTSDTNIWLADADQALLKGINLSNGSVIKQIQLLSYPTCRDYTNLNIDYQTFRLSYIPEIHNLLILDSINRLRVFSLDSCIFTNLRPLNISPMRLNSLYFNSQDATYYFTAEMPDLFCQTFSGSLNLRSGIIDYFVNPYLRIGKVQAAYVTNKSGKFSMLVPGYGEYETDLRSLQESPIHIFQDSFDLHSGRPHDLEHGYAMLFNLGQNNVMVRVYRSDSVKKLLYTQRIQLSGKDTLAGIFPPKKWYLTTTKSQYFQKNNMDLSVHDSTGRVLFRTKGNLFGQTLLTSYVSQQLFSNDGQHMLIREALSRSFGKDYCRLRIYKTINFHLEADISYHECPDDRVVFNTNSLFSSDSKSFFFAAREELESGPVTVLYRYVLSDSAAIPVQAIPVCGDSTCHLPFSVGLLNPSPDGTAMYYAGILNTNPSGMSPKYTQIVGCIDLSSRTTRWRMNLSAKNTVYRILSFDKYLSLQFEDYLDFFKVDNTGCQQFLEVTPMVNNITGEATNFYLSSDPVQSAMAYYERTGNEDILSFRKNEHSIRRSYFDQAFNRPDTILGLIPGSDSSCLHQFTAAIQKREKRLAFNPADLDFARLPELKIVSAGYVNSKFTMQLSVHSSVPIEKVEITVNGNHTISYFDSTDTVGPALSRNGLGYFGISLNLASGKNKIQCSVTDKDGREGLPVTMIQNELLSGRHKPKLHALILSVGTYKNRTPLWWSLKDGRDMADLFANHLSDTNFSLIDVDTLFDNQVTRARVEVWLDQQKSTNVDDYVVIFYNGHGFLDEQKNLLLTNPETELKPPYTHALEFQSILDAMDALPARQKLILVDACNSGDLDKDNDKSTFQFLKRRFTFTQQGSGTFVYAASSGFDQSGQPDKDDALQNDFFTAAIKSALIDHAASHDRYGRIFVNDLFRYVTPKTYQLSGKTQTPDLRTTNADNNWQLK